MSTVAKLADYQNQTDKLIEITYSDYTNNTIKVTKKDYIKAYMSILTNQIERGRE